ncbi:MAG: hypothetical protein Q8P21_01695 [bacterium]|nr:hypothetical protein [bacterium]
MHYLQSLLTLLIASNVPAERIWGILHSAGFEFVEENVIRREWGWMSASALRREMKHRASLCSKLFKEWEPRIAQLSALKWKTRCLLLDTGTELIRHQDGTFKCQAVKNTYAPDDESPFSFGSARKSKEKDPGVDAYGQRLYHAWITERFLCFAVRTADEYHIWRFHHELEKVDDFLKHEPQHHNELTKIHYTDFSNFKPYPLSEIGWSGL